MRLELIAQTRTIEHEASGQAMGSWGILGPWNDSCGTYVPGSPGLQSIVTAAATRNNQSSKPGVRRDGCGEKRGGPVHIKLFDKKARLFGCVPRLDK